MRPAALLLAVLTLWGAGAGRPAGAVPGGESWEPVGLAGGGGMFGPAISPADGRRMMVHCDMGAAYVTDDGGRSWRMIHHDQLTSNTRCRPAFHPTKAEVVYSPSGWEGRRLMRSDDSGARWREQATLRGPLRGPIVIDRDDPASMWVGVGEEVHHSGDGGLTWDACRGPAGEFLGARTDRGAARGRLAVFVATTRGLWRSTDGGRTWAEADEGLPSREIRAFAGAGGAMGGEGGGVLYCSVPVRLEDGCPVGGVYRSTDGAAVWRPAGAKGRNPDTKAFDRWAMGPVAQYPWLLASDADPRRVYAFATNTGIPPPHHATVLRSDDQGQTWRATFQADPRWPPANVEPDWMTAEDGQFYQGVPFGMAIDGRDADHLFFVESGAFATEDGGATWFRCDARLAPGERREQGPSAAGLRWACNGLVVTTTWNVYQDPFRRERRYICYTDIGFAISDDRGRTWRHWRQRGRPPWRNTCYELAFDPDVPGRVWGAFSDVHDIPNDNVISERHRPTGPGGVCASTDFGETWEPLRGGLPVAPVTSVVVDPRSRKGRRTLYAGLFGEGVWRSTDDGATWQPRNEGLGSEGNRRVARVHLHPDGTLFALVTARLQGGRFLEEGPGLYRSRDGGGRWEALTAGERLLWPKDFTVDPADADRVWLGAADAGGDGKGGLYRTTNGGRSWSRVAREGPQTFGAYPHPAKRGWVFMTLTEGAPGAGLWLSKDDGRTFAPVEGLPFRNAQRVQVLPDDPDAVYVTTFGGSVWRGTGLR